jgi:AcrR family transcriptional regulator
MIHIMKERKPYSSHLQQEHMEQTRDMILEGLIVTMAKGAVTWSIPDVAREAGVSVPTVYRYFSTKKKLVEALNTYVLRKAGIGSMAAMPRSPEELVAMARELYIRAEGMSDALRMASVSELAQEVRKEGIPTRLKFIEQALAPVLPSFSEQDQKYLIRMVLLLTSSAMIRAFNNYLDLTGEEAADIVAWAILTLVYSGTRGEESRSTNES